MTPAVTLLRKRKLPHTLLEYNHDSEGASYGQEAADKLNLAPDTVFKTLIVALSGEQYAMAIVPVTHTLDLKAIAKAAGVKKASMAIPADVERMTGYVLGGVSPLGQKKHMSCYIDSSANKLETFYVSGGRRGLEIGIAPSVLGAQLRASFAPLIST
ncbi:Cys-tRNA(Pro) deacylase [Aestuariibacter halophilus]|uniref:Cys-tRNA(Pro)/Cys-tRNA(Cys) deacylase n=1 Tax=Fluctibacter halophilus TaxID=226011 RepID=A0ABS8G8E6_9ALTE|nr:Cys-tRNA(Pro) deacylase [Aestuariibacter halophilus]MCC2616095.1 Cys-tRNA(Pro) deacylase [Aestuariibacter halophilus]